MKEPITQLKMKALEKKEKQSGKESTGSLSPFSFSFVVSEIQNNALKNWHFFQAYAISATSI